MTSGSLVSICIPTYRGSAFIGTTIESVLRQTHADFELIVVDDNSPDETEQVVRRYTDPRVKYHRNRSNLGPQGNWNRCLELARGIYFKLLPHDDLLTEDSLAKQVAVLEQDSGKSIALVFGARQIIDASGHEIMTRGLSGQAAGRISSQELVRRCIRAGANLIGEPGSGLVRRELTARLGPYDASLPYVVDLDYWFKVLQYGDGHYLDSVTSSFRLSKGSWSVAIGGYQFRDFTAFIDRVHKSGQFGLTLVDRAQGKFMAGVNTVARALMYRYVFR